MSFDICVSERDVFPWLSSPVHLPGAMSRNCHLCGKHCMSQTALQYHMNAHTGEKPYKCDVCGKGFTQKGNLKIHERVHTGEKPYKCSMCGNAYSQSGDLARHRKVKHSGVDRYSS